MKFTYQARDARGQVKQGETNADSVEAATMQLRQEGLYLLSIDEVKDEGKGGLSIFQKKVTRNDVIYLTNQMAVMIDAGVPLSTALEGLSTQGDNPTLKKMLSTIHKNVESGEDFSVALSRYPRTFDKTYVNLVKASEASGTLPQMLDRIALQMRSELETKQKVKGAMMYPGAMLVMCVGVSVFLLTYVFPKLTPMFSARQMELPTPTKILMGLSFALTNYWYLFVIGIVVLAVGLWYIGKQTWGRIAFDWCWMNVPLLGPVIRKVALSRSLRTLATTINAGVPMLDSLELTSGVSNNHFFEQCWLRVGEQVTAGKQIHEALDGNSLFPQTVLQMISSGESTGKLGHVLNKISDYFDREVENAIKAAMGLIEPIMVAVMGTVIGTIALAMLLPIFKLSSGH